MNYVNYVKYVNDVNYRMCREKVSEGKNENLSNETENECRGVDGVGPSSTTVPRNERNETHDGLDVGYRRPSGDVDKKLSATGSAGPTTSKKTGKPATTGDIIRATSRFLAPVGSNSYVPNSDKVLERVLSYDQ